MVSIAVQPPSQARAGNTLSPPIIVENDSGLIEIDVFATAVLCDTEGSLLTEHLVGTLVALEKVIEEYGTRKLVFIFHELAVRHPGKYTVRVDIYKMNDHAAEMVTQAETRIFNIYEGDVPSEMPSKLLVLLTDKAKPFLRRREPAL